MPRHWHWWMQVAFAIGMLLVGVLIGLSRKPPNYRETRTSYVRTAMQASAPVDTLILGDSIGESTPWVCGNTFNASIGGATVTDVAAIAPLAERMLHPKLIVVEVGANHFWNGYDPDFANGYTALVRSLRGRLILVGVPNSPQASLFIRSLAAQMGAGYIEPVTSDLTSDGVHPTIEGARLLEARLAALC